MLGDFGMLGYRHGCSGSLLQEYMGEMVLQLVLFREPLMAMWQRIWSYFWLRFWKDGGILYGPVQFVVHRRYVHRLAVERCK